MATQLITSFSLAGFRLYGERMVRSVARHWPSDVDLVVYADAPVRLACGELRLTTDLADWQACRQRWMTEGRVQGRLDPKTSNAKRYSYRWDAFRFAVKCFTWRDAARRLGRGVLMWLDGDTVTTAPVPVGWPEALLGDAEVAYLGRGPMHPENGYVGFRVPEALPLLEWCADAYATEYFRELPGWTDCHVLRAGIAAVAVRARDLTSHRYVGVSHIWPASPLAAYVTHHKGKSKQDAARKRATVGAA